jgi:hypothetical protein
LLVGCLQTPVGVGTTAVGVALVTVDVVVVGPVVGQGNVLVEVLEPELSLGGDFLKQLSLPPLPLLLEQNSLTLPHQSAKSKQSRASGQPALRKQEATWILQDDHAAKQLTSSVKSGSGVEHHFPHLYSHLGGVTMVAVHTAGAVEVVDTFVVRVEEVTLEVPEVVAAEVEEPLPVVVLEVSLPVGVELVVALPVEVELVAALPVEVELVTA